MSLVLGIANTSHDSSAALFRDGRLVAAISEERLSRIKCDGGAIPERAIDGVLQEAGATRRDVTAIGLIYADFPEEYFIRPNALKELERKLSRLRRRLVGGGENRMVWANHVLKEAMAAGVPMEQCFRRELFLEREGFDKATRIAFFDHHDIHAHLAAFYSGFGDCSVITMDGEGDLEECHTSSLFRGGRHQRCHVTTGVANSAGHFYMAITQLLGFRPLRHEGKVLGLAAFGDPKPLYETFSKALRLSPEGTRLLSDFRGDDERFDYLKRAIQGFSREQVAAAAQQVLEDTVVPLARNLVRETGLPRVALNGGVFANVKLNQRIAALPEVERIFVFPGMSDTGNSVGAALMMQDLLEPGFLARGQHRLRDVYWGPQATDEEIEEELKLQNLPYEKLSEEQIIERAAQAIAKGDVVGWFQGRMEFGPRALGNRSMVGRPTDAEINKTLNDRLERTEFMPFAPSALVEYADELFVGVDKAAHPAEFMTVTFDVKPEWHARIPAVVHVDGTARPQLVRQDTNPRYWKLIERYRQLSGIPVVLNTSFNVHEEPIVCGPEEGIRALAEDRIDRLAIGNYWVQGTRP